MLYSSAGNCSSGQTDLSLHCSAGQQNFSHSHICCPPSPDERTNCSFPSRTCNNRRCHKPRPGKVYLDRKGSLARRHPQHLRSTRAALPPGDRACRSPRDTGQSNGPPTSGISKGAAHPQIFSGHTSPDRRRNQPHHQHPGSAKTCGFSSGLKPKREARVGIEPTHRAFAEPGLTTWLPRRKSGHICQHGVNLSNLPI